MITVQLLIKGKVQGVFFRASAKKHAEALSLVGWVRNTDDGHVLSVVTGPDKDVQSFVKWCHNGPSKAQVNEVQVTTLEDTHFDEFSVRR